METWAVDFETYFDKECSVKSLGNRAYFAHPQFDAYLLTARSNTGLSFCGHPKEFDWKQLNGNRVLSHNASFDETLYLYGVEKGWWEDVAFMDWQCTADLCSFIKLPRNLSDAVETAFGVKLDKGVRSRMSGKTFAKLPKDKKEEFITYAEDDAFYCLKLWEDYAYQWPRFERSISIVNRIISRRGLPIDTEKLTKDCVTLREKLFEAEKNIPWIDEKPLLSRPAFNEQCRKVGIAPPASMAKTEVEATEFIRKNKKEHPWVSAVQDWRRINAMLKKLESFERAVQIDNRYYGATLYFGAHTGRFSGSGSNLNLQNLPRGELTLQGGEPMGVTVRDLIKAGPGKKLLNPDLSQIEVRTLCWLAGDRKMLDEIRASKDIYETFAVRFGRWSPENGPLKEKNPSLRHAVKQTVLGCGYQASAERYALMEDIPLEEAKDAVETYRNKMDKVVQLWNRYRKDLGICCNTREDFSINLPSGRAMNYGKIKYLNTGKSTGWTKFKYYGTTMKNGKLISTPLFGGKVAENVSQALARDIFCDILLRVEKAGWKTILHVHDELLIEVDEAEAETTLNEIIQIMETPPVWIPDIPLAAEGKILDRYEK